ncbi:MAG: hypothetical protein IT209_11985 [Armatimonadetes bacterium]|nr:hypothetical protein [Armatimonadota bacterium]
MTSEHSQRSELFALFHGLITDTFASRLGFSDRELAHYLAQMLTEFAHFDRIYRIKDLANQPLYEVADMLQQTESRPGCGPDEREREVHKHIGDFTLFWAGVYPEALRLLQSSLQKDHLVDYISQGKSSYYIASTFNRGDLASEARVLRCLSNTFEIVALGLQEVRSVWERNQA